MSDDSFRLDEGPGFISESFQRQLEAAGLSTEWLIIQATWGYTACTACQGKRLYEQVKTDRLASLYCRDCGAHVADGELADDDY